MKFSKNHNLYFISVFHRSNQDFDTFKTIVLSDVRFSNLSSIEVENVFSMIELFISVYNNQ